MANSLFDPSNNPTAVAIPGNLGATLRTAGAQAAQAGGMPFLKLRKQDGKLVYGVEETELKADEEWAVNFTSFKIGMIGWKGGQVVGEEMYPISHPEKVDLDSLEPIETGKDSDGWKDQITVEFKRLSDSTEVLFKTTSYGGKQMLGNLMGAIGGQLEENPDAPIAVVRLGSDSYKHPTYGLTFNPTFEIVSWLDASGKAPAPKREPKALV